MTIQRTNKRGFTIVEVLVASALLLVLSGSLLAVVKVTRDRFFRVNTLLEMEENLFLAANFLSEDLGLGNAGAVEVLEDNVISFLHPFDIDGQLLSQNDGSLEWGVGVAYYKEAMGDENLLIRQTESLANPVSQPLKLSSFDPPLGTNFFTSGSGKKRKIASGLESLSVSAIDNRRVEFSLELLGLVNGRRHGVQVSQRVFCRN